MQRLSEIIQSEGAEADEQAIELIARRAAGSMRDSQSLLEQVLSFSQGKLTADSVHAMLGTADDARLHALATAMADRDSALSMKLIDAAMEAGVDAGRLAEQLLGYFRDLMAITVGCEPSLLQHTSASMQSELAELGSRWGLQTVLAVIGLVDQTLVRIRHSVYSRVLLEATLIQICNLPDLQNIANLAAASGTVASGQARSKTGRAGSAPVKSLPAPSIATDEKKKRSLITAEEDQPPAMMVAESTSEPDGTTGDEAQVAAPAQAKPAQAQAKPTQSETRAKDALSTNDTEAVWKRAMGEFEDMTATLARNVISVAPVRAGHLRLTFPAESNLAMRRCETTEHVAEITSTLSRLTGTPMTIEFHAAAPKARPKVAAAVAKGPSRMQRMKDLENNPLIQACVETLGAEIVRIDRPRD